MGTRPQGDPASARTILEESLVIYQDEGRKRKLADPSHWSAAA